MHEFHHKIKSFSQEKLNDQLVFSCEDGQIDEVVYLLTSRKLNFTPNIYYKNEMCFRKACEFGHLDVVKYLLTSTDIKDHSNIHAKDDQGFIVACLKGHLSLVEYLLNSPDLTDHAIMDTKDGYGFRLACENNKTDIIDYLLFTQKIIISPTMKTWLEVYEHTETIRKINFRDLSHQLESSLENPIDTHKMISKI